MVVESCREPFSLVVGGKKLFGIYHCPKESSPLATLLVCHGLGGDKQGRYRIYVKLAEMLAKCGVATIRFDFRGCGDSEGELGQMSLATQVEDAQAVLDWAFEKPLFNQGPMAILGSSFGGLVAVQMAARNKELFKGIILWAPVFNGMQWQEAWNRLKSGGLSGQERDQLTLVNGERANPMMFQELFTLKIEQHLLEVGHLPLLHLHGDQDQRVTLLHAEAYQTHRQGSKAPSTFIRLAGADHGFSDQAVRQEVLNLSTEWLCDNLLNGAQLREDG